MMHLARVLFPTDGSECAERARHHAHYLADWFEATLHVVHVEERPTELADVIDVREADVRADLHVPRDEPLLVAEPRVQERRVVHPSAADGVLTYAVEHDTNLIVMGTHGRGGLRRLVLGSVAEEVVRRAPVPVMTVGRGARPSADLEEGTLLVPVDLSERQPRLLAHARELALAYGMTMTLLHVVERLRLPDVYEVSSSAPEPSVLAERAEEALAAEAEALRDRGVDTRVTVRTGHPAEETIEAADELGADLLTIATHGRSGIERMVMGSVAETVLRRAPCPVFTVKSLGPSLVEDGAN
jgi:nucleotide-binding universal stress UspA family protein